MLREGGGGVGTPQPPHVRLGHREAGADHAGEQGIEPLPLLLVGAEQVQQFHVAGVRCGAVEGDRRQVGRAAGELGDRRVVEIGQPGQRGQEQIPQPASAGLGHQLEHDRRYRVVGQSRLGPLPCVHGFGGVDAFGHERLQLGEQAPALR
jgi:hypothetical protein